LDEFTVGRNGTVAVPLDLAMCDKHVSVKRDKDGWLSLAPVRAKRPVQLLLGRSRPAVALRLGDCFSLGRSEFCVVFVQRGNRQAMPPDSSVAKELAARVLPTRTGEGLRETKSSKPSLLTPRVPEPKFANLDLDLDAPDADEPTFRDVNALLEHFHLGEQGGDRPLLVVNSTKGPRAKEFFLRDPLEPTFGNVRGGNATVCIQSDRRISPLHCRVYFDERAARWMLGDLESEHGTYLKIKMDMPLLLCAGDVFCLGNSVMEVLSKTEEEEEDLVEQTASISS
jgi:hypothetical protein